ncbi:hypothetical protein BsWGS_21588 [Bradybaena similaris]
MAASLWWDDAESSNKSGPQSKTEDLLVFGYACKLFRDDKKARAIDNGKLLIPWMGDDRLMIDRYDGRGHLYDLAAHDADNIEDKNPVPTEEEAAVEKACDEERYLELHTDLRQAELYEEEEWKRYYLSLQEGYQAVGFSYDQQTGTYVGQAQPDESGAAKEADEKPFVVPEELHVPPDMKMPTCIKQNARIEKTASFIAQHGIQMEIMLKTKQSGNSQFDFLHFDNELNPYYKHVVSMIKSGKYKPQEEEENMKKEEEYGQHYLHPSLSSTSLQLPPPPPPTLKPIELPKVSINDTPYGALIQSIQRNTEASRISALAEAAAAAAAQSAQEDQQTPTVVPYSDNPPPPGTEPVTLPASSLNGQAFVDQLYSQSSPPGSEGDGSAHHTESERKRRRRSSSSESSSSSSSTSSGSSGSSGKRRSPQNTKEARQPRFEGPSPIQLPPPDIQPIIDRMAMYVAKNGVEFEMVVTNRKDPRFQFLNEYHVYFPFYRQMKEKYVQEFIRLRAEAEKEANDDKLANNSQRSVSFSIKARQRDQEGGQHAGKARLFEYDSEGEEKLEGEANAEVTSGTATPPVKVQMEEDPQKEMEEKLKDKLASALKERISQSHREKQLQMERKKKATAFLHLIKSSLPVPPQSSSEDLASAFLEETPPLVFEYNNQSQPVLVERKEDSPRSPADRKRRRRSPTPPSAYSLDRRSPSRPSPSAWVGRMGAWSGARERTAPWQHPARERTAPNRRSRSRSPHRKDERKKKHKQSKLKSPSRQDRHKDKSRHSHSQDKSKHRHKDRDRKKEKKKSKHRSKDRESKHSRSKHSSKGRSESRVSSSGDIMNSLFDASHVFSQREKLARNGRSMPDFESGELAEPDVILKPSSSTERVLRNSKSLTQSESADERQMPSSRPSSTCNSPIIHAASVSRGSTPSRPFADSASADLMSKVRAMLKKSRELIMKEEGSLLDDT